MLLCGLAIPCFSQYQLASPDGKIIITAVVDSTLTWSLTIDGKQLLDPSEIGIVINDQRLSVTKGKVKSSTRRVDEMVRPVVPRRQAVLNNTYNELTLKFRSGFSAIFRAYDYGVAYRIRLDGSRDVEVTDEVARFNFPANTTTLFPEEESFISHNERIYKDTTLASLSSDQFCSLPVLFKNNEINLVYSDADLFDYPNMLLRGTGQNSVEAIFPKAVLAVDSTSDRSETITKTADYIAKTSGDRGLPWRAFSMGRQAGELLEHDLVFVLSTENVIDDPSWIRPGRVAWDWYNALNIYGVDFKSGLNTETYKYYIDFASAYGLEYIILDEGWSKSTTDLLAPNKDIDIRKLVAYGESKHVGIILWTLWKPLIQRLDETLDLWAEWGIKGVKMDFMQRSDQQMVNIQEEVARACAAHHMLADFHGTFKPAGLQRKYPNYISNEGVKGSENNKWSADITPRHNVTIPYIRMTAGAMDYTPGVMRNAQEVNFHISFERPVSLGTRAHQVAMYVVYESPLQMFADSPSNYLADPECTGYMSRIPVTWDETRAIEGKVGEYIVVARRKGSTWYLGGMTDWNERNIEVPMDMLGEGSYEATIFSDGTNAARFAEDYKISETTLDKSSKLTVHLAPGGGYVAILEKK